MTEPLKPDSHTEIVPPANADSREAWLRQLLANQRSRQEHSQTYHAEVFLEEDTQLQSDQDALLDLIYHEIVLRQESGETPDVEEYVKRFPHLEEALRIQFDLEQHLDDSDFLEVTTGEQETIPPNLLGSENSLPNITGYELIRVLGQGGMGTVYEAKHLGLNRTVALKTLRSGRDTSADEITRLRREAEVIAKIQHPNVVQIYDVGELDGGLYLALEYVEGGNLSEQLKGVPIDDHQAATLIETLARGIHIAHEQQIIHRDLKPANVLITKENVPKITDFGLAKIIQDDTGQTRTGAYMGTPSYSSPEQAEGLIHELGPRTDVYALGAVLYELLTGRPPFKGTNVLATLDAVRFQEPIRPVLFNHELEEDLEVICLKCLRKEQQGRYQTALELAEDLRRFREGEPIHARPVGRVEKAFKWINRHPATAGLLFTGVIALVALIAFGITKYAQSKLEETNQELVKTSEQLKASNKQLDEARNEVVNANLTLKKTNRQLDVARQTAENFRYAADINLARRAWEDGRIVRMRSLLDGLTPTRTGDKDFRSFEWYYLNHLPNTGGEKLSDHATGIQRVRFNRDGKLFASVGERLIIVWNAETNERSVVLNTFGQPNRDIAFSPDGKYVVVVVSRRDFRANIRLLDMSRLPLGSKQMRQIPSLIPIPVRAYAQSVCFRPDSREFAVGLANGQIVRWDMLAKKALPPIMHARKIHAVQYNPTGTMLASASELGTICLWDVKTGKQIRELNPYERGSIHDLCFSPDGSRLVSGNSAGRVHLWDVKTGEKLLTLKGHRGSVNAVAFDPKGTRFASASDDFTVRLWNAKSGQLQRVLRGHLGDVNGLVFHPRKPELFSGSADKIVRRWLLNEDQESESMQFQLPPMSLAVHPSKPFFAVGKREGIIEIRHTQTREILQRITLQQQPMSSLAFHPTKDILLSSGFGNHILLHHLWLPSQNHQRAIAVATLSGLTNHVWTLAGLLDEQVKTRSIPRLDTQGLCFSPDGLHFAIAAKNSNVMIYDSNSLQLTQTIHSHQLAVHAVAYSPNGQQLASGGADGRVRIHDPKIGKGLAALSGHVGTILTVAYNPQGTRLASAGDDQIIRLWNPNTGKELLQLKGHDGPIHRVCFNQEGSRIFSCSTDQTIKIWDAHTGLELLTLSNHQRKVNDIALLHDETELLSVSEDGTLKFWVAPKLAQTEQPEKVSVPIKPVSMLIEGWLDNKHIDSQPERSRRFAQFHSVNLKAGQSYLIDVIGEYDTWLRIEDDQHKPLLRNDDTCARTDTDARILFEPTYTGQHHLVVSKGEISNHRGRYFISIRKMKKAGPAKLIQGNLTKWSSTHSLPLNAHQPCTLELTSHDFNARLSLVGKEFMGSDNTFTSENGSTCRLDVTPQFTGNHEVVIDALKSGQTGTYTLKVQPYDISIDDQSELDRLAWAYQIVGQSRKAIPLWERRLKLFDDLESNPSERLEAMQKLALAYWHYHEFEQAMQMQEQVVNLMQKHLPEHELHFLSLWNLANMCWQQQRYAESLHWLQLAHLRIPSLKNDCPSYVIFARLTKQRPSEEQLSQAKELLDSMFARWNKLPSRYHPHTLSCRNWLTIIQAMRGNFSSAANDFAAVSGQYHGRRDHLPPAVALYENAASVSSKGKRKNSRNYDVNVWHLHLFNFGPDHPITEEARAKHARTALQNQDWDVVKQSKNVHDFQGRIDRWWNYWLQSSYGVERIHARDWQEAEVSLLAAFDGLRACEYQLPMLDHDPILETIQGLIDLYQKLNKPTELAKWRQFHRERVIEIVSKTLGMGWLMNRNDSPLRFSVPMNLYSKRGIDTLGAFANQHNYRFQVEKGQQVRLEVKAPYRMNPHVRVIDPQGKTLTIRRGSSTTVVHQFVAQSDGVYRVSVFAGPGGYHCPYRFNVQLQPNP